MLNHSPGIFIGLGGAGVKSLARLKAKMYALYKESDALAKFDEHSFIYIDSDANDIDKINQSDDLLTIMDGNLPIHHSELIDLGRTVPQAVRENMMQYARPDVEHFFSWMITEKDNPKFRLIGQSLSNGAGASRIDGRTAFYDNFQEIKNCIESRIYKLAETDIDWGNPDTWTTQTKFWVISGTNGGTGSSMTLDILFLIERLCLEKHTRRPFVNLALVMPQAYCDLTAAIDNIMLNSFASLWELSAFKTQQPRFTIPGSQIDTNHYNYFFATPDFKGDQAHCHEPWGVFDYCLVFDSSSKDGMIRLELNDVFDNVSDTILSLSCTKIGAQINRILGTTNYELETSGEAVVSNQPKIIEGQKWGRFAVATGTQSITKPINEFKSYLRARFKLEMLQFGLIGESFENVHRNSIEKQQAEIAYICNELLFKGLFSKNEELIPNEKNLLSIIESEFRKLTNPEDIEIKEKKLLGRISRGFEDGIFYEVYSAIKNELQQKLYEIRNLFEQKNKKELLDAIKENLKSCLEILVLKYGYQYACDIFNKLDVDLESGYGATYLSDFNLISLKSQLNSNFSDIKLRDIEGLIEECCSQNEDLEAFIYAIEAYVSFNKVRLLQEIKYELVNALVAGRDGILDRFLSSPSGEYGIHTILVKLKKELSITEHYFKKLALYFERNENHPLTVFIPPLNEMVNNSDWMDGSVFDTIYNRTFPRQSDDLYPEVTTKPTRNGPESLGEVLYLFRQWVTEKGIENENQGPYFSDLALNGGVSFTQFLEYFFDAQESYFEIAIMQQPEIMDWINSPLSSEFYRFKYENTNEKIQTLKNQFARDLVFYPTNAYNQNIEKLIAFSGGRDLERLAIDMGYNPNNQYHLFYVTNDDMMLTKMVFEAGHTLGEYVYLQNYASFYEQERTRIRNYEIGCHIHKHFNTLNLDLALNLVNQDYIPHEAKIYAVELLYYSALFKFMMENQAELYYQMFNDNPKEYLLPGSAEEITPIMWVTHDPTTIFYREIEVDSETGKLIFAGLKVFRSVNCKNLAQFLVRTLQENASFQKQIKTISSSFELNKDGNAYRKGIFDSVFKYIQLNHESIVQKSAELIKISQWQSEMNDLEADFVANQFDQLRTENIFKL